MIDTPAAPKVLLSSLMRRALWLVLVQALVVGQAVAQSSATDTRTPSALTPGASAGTYPLSGFDNVNLYTGGLNFHLPLLRVGGRGGASYTMMLTIEQKWRVNHDYEFAQHWPNHNWWTGRRPGYGPGILQGRQTNEGCPESFGSTWSMTTLTFTTPDGTEYELRDASTGGNRLSSQCFNSFGVGASRGTVFKSFDGSAATFVSDAVINDWTGGMESGPHIIEPTGHLMLRDGTRYRIEWGKVMWMRDRNGNRLSFEHNSPYGVTRVTDSLGRVITIEYDVNDPQYGLCDRISFAGFNAEPRKIWVAKTTLANALRATRPYDVTTPQTYANLFPYLTGSSTTTHNPTGAVRSVWLPNGQRYQLFYNTYSELARVVLPTGGAIEYDWQEGGGGTICSNGPEILRSVAERRVYRDGSALEGKMTYGEVVKSLDANGNVLAYSKHYFHGGAPQNPCPSVLSHSQWNEGKEYQTEEYTADGVTMLSKITRTWQQTTPSWYWSAWTAEPANNPKLVTTVTTVEPHPGGANLVSKQTAINPQTGAVGFDQFNNPTDVWEYDFGAGAAPAYPVRHVHTDYLTINPANGLDYTGNGVHIRGLPSAQQTYSVNPSNGAETLVAKSETKYDETALLPWYGTVQSWADPGAPRGNPTKERRWLNISGTWVESRAQFDQVGNVSKSWDAKNNQKEIIYAAANHFAYATQTISPVPDPANQYGSNTALVAYTTYDFSTGLVTSTTDANNQITNLFYADELGVVDKLDRLRKVVRPGGMQAGGGGQTLYSYGDTPGNMYVRTQTAIDATRSTDAYQYFDGQGRLMRSIQYENHDPAKPWITVDTEYDALGRAKRASLPYRAAGGAAMFSTDKWTETAYDALGRVKTVTTRPDNAVVTTDYSGNRVTITDQAGKKRRSVTDGLGRLTRVDEPDASGNLDSGGNPAQPTYYTYDALDNLRKVQQGTQHRYFMYDSLSRMIRAKNPEQGDYTPDPTEFPALTDPITSQAQWSVAYNYDANGNPVQRKDARNVKTTYGYDALNRNTTVRYTDGMLGPENHTKDVDRHYDNPTSGANGRGRFHFSNWDAANNTRFDTHLAVDSYDAAGRPKNFRQHFFTNGVASVAFTVERTYDLAGNVLTQKYPSQRTVTYAYDGVGRLNSFVGNLGDGVQRNYSTGIIYDELGGMSREQFGTNTPLYNRRFYNSRGQLSEIRVGTYHPTDDGWWNRGAILNVYSGLAGWTESREDNNGNLRKQMVFIPNDEQISGWFDTNFFYDYDSLNRLEVAREVNGGQNRWVQDYDYDRWGNRTINAGATTNAPEPQFEPDAANPAYRELPAPSNRLYAPGDGGRMPGQKLMGYDAAGNLTNDAYTGYGARSYDAENRMTSARDVYGQTSTYVYDADGRRVRRRVAGGAEVFYVYGMGGELVAEYASSASAATPQKEYGYRNGELLVNTAAPQTNGTGLTAQYFDNVDFTGPSVTRVDPTLNFDWGGGTPHPSIGAEEFSARWTGTVQPLYSQTYTFYTVSDDGVRLWVNGQLLIDKWIDQAPTEWSGQITLQAGQRYDIRVEFYERFWGATAKLLWSSPSQPKEAVPQSRLFPSGGDIQWLVHDHLGTPRMVIDKTGNLSGVKRHDYRPFGDELFAGSAGREWSRGYTADNISQQFTQKERDGETGLDYFGARYLSSVTGRFTSVDPIFGSLANPQKLNRYTYASNNPLSRVDPNGAKDMPAHVKRFVFMNMQMILKTALSLNVSFGGLFALAAWETQWGQTSAYRTKNNPGGMSVSEVPLSYATLEEGYKALAETIKKNFSDVLGIHDPRKFLESIQDENGYRWNTVRKDSYLKNVRDGILLSFGFDFFDDCVLAPIRNGRDVTFNGVTVSNETELNNLLNSSQPSDQQMVGSFMAGVYQEWVNYVKNIGSEKDKNIQKIRSAGSLIGADPVAEEEAAYAYRVSRVLR